MAELSAQRSAADRPEAEPPAGVIIRPALPDDAASHVALWTAVVAEGCWLEMAEFDHSVREYRDLFQHSVNNNGARLAAVADRDVVGSIRIARINTPARLHVAYLAMAVAASWRRKGIGASLVSEALRWAASAQIEKVTLGVYASNSAAVALYRKVGFLEEGRLLRQSKKASGYEDEVLMARWFTPG
jgi:ribosomal protein S18 acetylase RimI-like enzyme